jgi:hypothetical protein
MGRHSTASFAGTGARDENDAAGGHKSVTSEAFREESAVREPNEKDHPLAGYALRHQLVD